MDAKSKFSNRGCFNYVRVLFISLICFSVADMVNAQQNLEAGNLEQRVAYLENYVDVLQKSLVELSENMNTSMQEYTNNLELSLENYSQGLQYGLEERVKSISRNSVVLNPFSKAYLSINTNTGIFLLSVDHVEPIDDGVRLHLNIGNPNFANYQDFKLKFYWGNRWGGVQEMPYAEWRQSLKGVEYTFKGLIEKGKWNSMSVNLVPAGDGQLEYVECEMAVNSVELGYN